MTQRMVCGFAFSGSQVLLIWKQKPEWQKGCLNGIGGKIEEGESAAEAMVREFEEETGVKTAVKDWHHAVEMKGNQWQVSFFTMELTKAQGRRAITQEKEKLQWIFAAQIRAWKCVNNLIWLIPLCQQIRNYSTPVLITEYQYSTNKGRNLP